MPPKRGIVDQDKSVQNLTCVPDSLELETDDNGASTLNPVEREEHLPGLRTGAKVAKREKKIPFLDSLRESSYTMSVRQQSPPPKFLRSGPGMLRVQSLRSLEFGKSRMLAVRSQE
jgi:hypothetical protein